MAEEILINTIGDIETALEQWQAGHERDAQIWLQVAEARALAEIARQLRKLVDLADTYMHYGPDSLRVD